MPVERRAGLKAMWSRCSGLLMLQARWPLALLLALVPLAGVFAAPDISSVKPDLHVPEVEPGEPAAGKRVKQTHPQWADTEAHHLLYLPRDWKKGGTYPVIVEYAGNGPYRNKHGDRSTGQPEGSRMGYGLTAGQRYIWLCLPYLSGDGRSNVRQWWGDRPTYAPANTLAYAKTVVPWVCEQYGGDPDKVFLCGFSRGAIACNFIGLHDDEVARLWCAFLPYSHYDGVRRWAYPGSDRDSARKRLARLDGRPQFITHENDGVEATRAWILSMGMEGDFTFRATGFRNHNDAWLLRPSPVRKEMRAWMRRIAERPGG